jgi:hypothetical protein
VTKKAPFKDLRRAMRQARTIYGDHHTRLVLRAICGVSNQQHVYREDIGRLIEALTDFEAGRAAIAYAFKESES